ncbi:MAG TPA: hypothetical protein DCQ31_00435, partial [Bacteroidales bacterium]|nr:hypothetical protein [Bacteroidales bacterium]
MVFLDFSNLKLPADVSTVMGHARNYIHKQPVKSVYSLASIENMHFNNEIRDLFGELLKSNKPFIKASAIVGVIGLKQLVFNGLMRLTGRDVKSFDTLDQAKDWLAMH